MSAGWIGFIVALVVLNILGCVWLLWWTGRRRPGDPAPEDTSHVWDGDLTEYNKPLPKWWINLFYLTIVFSIGYIAWYGGLGVIPGYAGWSSTGEHDEVKAVQDKKLEATFAPFANQPIDALAKDPKALALGRSIFNNTCATCHGSTGQGATGYPNLTDGIWHWGGTPDLILQTVLDGREGVMPARFNCACTASMKENMPGKVVWIALIVTPFGKPASVSSCLALPIVAAVAAAACGVSAQRAAWRFSSSSLRRVSTVIWLRSLVASRSSSMRAATCGSAASSHALTAITAGFILSAL